MINADKPHLWKPDMIASVAMYNEWFLEAAPKAYRDTRANVVDQVNDAFMRTSDLSSITPLILKTSPAIISTLRMSTAPPIARDRLVGLSHSTSGLIKTMEGGGVPPRMSPPVLDSHLERICLVLLGLLDVDLFPWLDSREVATDGQVLLASTVVADRLCGSVADPIVRNAQEKRQLALIGGWLDSRGYVKRSHPGPLPIQEMPQGTYSFRQNVIVGGTAPTNMPIDVVVQPHRPASHGIPVLIEAKSAGDSTNTNKRRKEEAQKMHQLRDSYGTDVSFLLFLCGYFDSGYLGYEAAEGIDWVWEHRIDDLVAAGV